MPVATTLNEAIYATLHRSKKNIKEIADEIGKSESLLYRWAAPEGTTSHADLPVRMLVPLLIASQNDTILDYLERKRGRIAVRVPRAAASKLDESEIVQHYQGVTLQAVRALSDFFKDPGNDTYKKADAALHAVMQESVSIDKYVQRRVAGQFELEL